jgi:hypothetical protein
MTDNNADNGAAPQATGDEADDDDAATDLDATTKAMK